MFSFQGLHPGQFISADHLFTLSDQLGCLFIQAVDGAAFFIKYRFTVAAGQPVTDLVGFEIRFFLKDDPRDGPKCSQRCLVW